MQSSNAKMKYRDPVVPAAAECFEETRGVNIGLQALWLERRAPLLPARQTTRHFQAQVIRIVILSEAKDCFFHV